MMVADLTHFLDLPEETPGPARRLAADLCDIVRAATAGDDGIAWTSALPCRRRPGHRPCTGWLVVQRSESPAPVRWQCAGCGDEGLISGWEDSPFDLRLREPDLDEGVNEYLLPAHACPTLRELRTLDFDSQRLVYRIRVDGDHVVMAGVEEDEGELARCLLDEFLHERDPRRRRRLEAALDALRG